jgi:hypothetical protein
MLHSICGEQGICAFPLTAEVDRKDIVATIATGGVGVVHTVVRSDILQSVLKLFTEGSAGSQFPLCIAFDGEDGVFWSVHFLISVMWLTQHY